MQHREEDIAANGTVMAMVFDTDAGTVTTTVNGVQTNQRPITVQEQQDLTNLYAGMARTTYGSTDALLAALIRDHSSNQDVNNLKPWVQPLGSFDAYLPSTVVTYNSHRWRNDLTILNVWEPGTQNAGWTDLDATIPTGPQEWVQPTGSTDAYNLGEQVTHNGLTWISQVSANVWEPGVYGWVQS